MNRLPQPNGRFLVVDANVIGHASRDSIDDQASNAVEILCKIKRANHKVVVDYLQRNQDNIINEYDRQTKSAFTRNWLIEMNRREKIVPRHRSTIEIRACTDPTDQKYFQVAINTTHKIIISEDSHFTDIKEDDEVTNHGITIWEFDDAISNL